MDIIADHFSFWKNVISYILLGRLSKIMLFVSTLSKLPRHCKIFNRISMSTSSILTFFTILLSGLCFLSIYLLPLPVFLVEEQPPLPRLALLPLPLPSLFGTPFFTISYHLFVWGLIEWSIYNVTL